MPAETPLTLPSWSAALTPVSTLATYQVLPGAHSQAETLEELNANLREGDQSDPRGRPVLGSPPAGFAQAVPPSGWTRPTGGSSPPLPPPVTPQPPPQPRPPQESARRAALFPIRVVALVAGVLVDEFRAVPPDVLAGPGRFPGGRIVHREVVEDVAVRLQGQALGDVELLGRSAQERPGVEVHRVDDQGVAFPPADGISQPLPLFGAGGARRSGGRCGRRGSSRSGS